MLSDEMKEQLAEATNKLREEIEADALYRGGNLISYSIRSLGVPSTMLGERERGITIKSRLPLPFAPKVFEGSVSTPKESCLKYSPHKFIFGQCIDPTSIIIQGRQCGKTRLRAKYMDELLYHMGFDPANGRDETVKLRLSGTFGSSNK